VNEATGKISNATKRFLLFFVVAVALNIFHLSATKLMPEHLLSLRSGVLWVKVLVLLEGAALLGATSAFIGVLEESASEKRWSKGTLAGMLISLVCCWGFFVLSFR
jgi:hypothetical protein